MDKDKIKNGWIYAYNLSRELMEQLKSFQHFQQEGGISKLPSASAKKTKPSKREILIEAFKKFGPLTGEQLEELAKQYGFTPKSMKNLYYKIHKKLKYPPGG